MLPSSSDAYTALQNFKAPDAQSLLTQANGQYGVADQQKRVSDLRGTVNNLQSSLNAVDPSVTGRTTGTFTTEGQRQALVSKEQAPIATNLNAAGTNLNAATGDLNLATGNAQSLANALFGQGQQQYQKLLDQYNAASAAEKEAEATRQFNASQELEQQKLAETKREADQSAKGGIDLSKYLSGNGSGSQLPAGMSFKNQTSGDAGFNFNLNGTPLSAGAYSVQSKIPIGDLLHTMGSNGDPLAQQAYNWLHSIQGSDFFNSGKYKQSVAYTKTFAPLFWGT